MYRINATVQIRVICEIRGYPFNLKSLFSNL